MIKINVNKNGIEGTLEPKVGTKKQEIERERLAQKNAAALNQQEGAELIMDEGLGNTPYTANVSVSQVHAQ